MLMLTAKIFTSHHDAEHLTPQPEKDGLQIDT